MDFKKAAILGLYISKDYAEDLFSLLVAYSDISASEAASRLDMHIKTVQDFLEAMASLDILSRQEVYEKKRPYFRYSLIKRHITMDIDLNPLYEKQSTQRGPALFIRERKNAGARFSTARNNQYISSIVIWFGTGRERKERKINLTLPQGKFLFHLPFPSTDYQSVNEIMKKAEVSEEHTSEVLNIVTELIELKVIEVRV